MSQRTYLLELEDEGRTYPGLANHRSILDRCIVDVDGLLLLYYLWQNITGDRIMISNRGIFSSAWF